VASKTSKAMECLMSKASSSKEVAPQENSAVKGLFDGDLEIIFPNATMLKVIIEPLAVDSLMYTISLYNLSSTSDLIYKCNDDLPIAFDLKILDVEDR